jgi:cysteine protease ATG4
MEKEKDKKFKSYLKAKCFDNSYKTKNEEEGYLSFWGLSNSLFNIRDYFKYNLISLNYKFYPDEKSIIHIFNKSYSPINVDFMNQKLEQLIYITYRNNYKPQVNSKNKSIYNSDCGWGCMIRSSQMILARAIYKIFKYEEGLKHKKIDKKNLIKKVIYFFLDNDLKLSENDKENSHKYFGMNNYISKLKDYNKKNKRKKGEIYAFEPPFSIQKICILGELFGRTCGEWFSDFDLPKIFNLINEYFNVFPRVIIHHYNSNLSLNDFMINCAKEITKENEKYAIYDKKKYIFDKICIIFISIRLGLQSISEEYFPSIKKLFNCKEFLGFVGGRVQSASYFFGYINNDLLFMDPHYNQSSIKDLEIEGISTYMNKTIYTLPLTNLQTALTLGFLLRNNEEFIDFLKFCNLISKDENSAFYISGIKNLVVIDNE